MIEFELVPFGSKYERKNTLWLSKKKTHSTAFDFLLLLGQEIQCHHGKTSRIQSCSEILIRHNFVSTVIK